MLPIMEANKAMEATSSSLVMHDFMVCTLHVVMSLVET